MSRDYDYSYEWDERYCYPKSHVLKNKLGITDAEQLRTAEREITSLRIANARINPIEGNFDFDHLKRLHKYIFGDIYDWAGEIRWVNISKGNQFCLCEYINANAEKVFTKLADEKLLTDMGENTISLRLAYYLGEINVIHPFREGNGRTQRLFFELLAENAGYNVDFSQVSEREMIEASADSFACDYGKMNALFQRITSPRQEQTMSQTMQ